MQNHDEIMLRSRQVQPSAPFPVAHQAVRIALYDEYAARSFYTRVIEAFGPRAPFANIVRAEQQHVDALSRLCDRLGCARPLDPFPMETTVAPTWRANCERAVAGEIANVRLYDSLLPYAVDAGMQQVFLNLQSASRDNHLPAFRQAVADAIALEQYHASHGIAPVNAHARHGAVADFLERAFAQFGPRVGPLGLVSPLIRNAHPAMLAGMVTGAAGVYLYRHKTGRPHKEN